MIVHKKSYSDVTGIAGNFCVAHGMCRCLRVQGCRQRRMIRDLHMHSWRDVCIKYKKEHSTITKEFYIISLK